MKNEKFYYDEEIKSFYYEDFNQSFFKVKEDLKDYTLRGLLTFQTKPYLTEIAKRLEVKGYSKLSKDKLVDLVAESINNTKSEILSKLTYKELSFLQELLKNNVNKFVFNVEQLTSISGLSALGIVHKLNIKDSNSLVVAEEFKPVLKKLLKDEAYMEQISYRSAAIAYIEGVMAHYGVVFAADINDLICDEESHIFVKEDLDFYFDYIFRTYEAFIDANSLIHPFVFAPENIIEELKVRQTIPYNFGNSDFFIALGSDYKVEFGTEINRLKDYLISKKVNNENIDLMIMELIYNIKNDLGTMSIVKFIEENGLKLEMTDSQELVSILVEVYNNVHMWVLKGLTPVELQKMRQTTIVKEKEPGRNDPCPCNSGKKYKKCCGVN